MDQQSQSPEELALKILYSAGSANQKLFPYRKQILAQYSQIQEILLKYSFDRFTNWGLRLAHSALPQNNTKNNYFLARAESQNVLEYEARFHALDGETLFSAIKQFCFTRYNEDVRAIFVFGGYLYGVTPKPDDLDIAVILKNSYIIENAIEFQYPDLANCITYHRKPVNKIGLAIVGDLQINKLTQNNTVLRTGVILGTTASRLAGEQLAIQSPPIAVLLYHAVEMVTWGFKLCFNENAEDSGRALWRIGEALHILNFIRQKIRSPIANQDATILFLNDHLSGKKRSDKNASELFLEEAIRFKENILLLKKYIRNLALQKLEQLLSGTHGDT